MGPTIKSEIQLLILFFFVFSGYGTQGLANEDLPAAINSKPSNEITRSQLANAESKFRTVIRGTSLQDRQKRCVAHVGNIKKHKLSFSNSGTAFQKPAIEVAVGQGAYATNRVYKVYKASGDFQVRLEQMREKLRLEYENLGNTNENGSVNKQAGKSYKVSSSSINMPKITGGQAIGWLTLLIVLKDSGAPVLDTLGDLYLEYNNILNIGSYQAIFSFDPTDPNYVEPAKICGRLLLTKVGTAVLERRISQAYGVMQKTLKERELETLITPGPGAERANQ
jgi:hypothetical protein